MHKLFLALLLLTLVPFAPAKASSDSQPLPLKFTSVDGKSIDLADMRGKVVLVDFWATWCPGCREYAPDLVKTYNKYHGKGFEIIGISLDQDKDSLKSFTKSNGMVWPQYFDGKGWENDISSSFGIQELPSMILVGKDGKVVHPDGTMLEDKIAQLVK